MTGSSTGSALVLAGISLLVGSAVFLVVVRLSLPTTPRMARRIARKVRATQVVLVLSLVVAGVGWWLAQQ